MSETLILVPGQQRLSAHVNPQPVLRGIQTWLDQRVGRENYVLRQTFRPEFGTVVTLRDPRTAHLFLLAWSHRGARQIQPEDLESPLDREYVDQYIRNWR